MIVTSACFLYACAARAPSKNERSTPVDPGDEFGADGPVEPDPLGFVVNEDSGAFGASSRPSHKDASLDEAGNLDGGPLPKTYCTGAIVAGDLAVVELQIASRTGALDNGEWVEIRSTRACWLKLDGVTVESPRASLTNRAALAGELAPGTSIVVADSADPIANHGVGGFMAIWAATDVLKNDGDTISIKLGALVVDSLTYPAFSNLEPGRTVSFPSDCPASARSDWRRWSLSFHGYGGTFEGTPNTPNDDITCF